MISNALPAPRMRSTCGVVGEGGDEAGRAARPVVEAAHQVAAHVWGEEGKKSNFPS